MKEGEKRLQEGLEENNSWYTCDQHTAATMPSYQNANYRRWKFFQKWLQKQQKKDQPLSILDAGCGDGVNLQVLTASKDANVWACDYNPLRIERLKERYPMVNGLVEDLLKDPGPHSPKYDFILCSQVIEHIDDDLRMLKNLKSRLSPNGVLMLGTPNEGCLLAQLRNRFFEREISKTTDHVHFYTERKLYSLFQKIDFEVVDTMRQRFFFPHQKIFSFFASRNWGNRFMNRLGHLIPSQAAEYYFVLQAKK